MLLWDHQNVARCLGADVSEGQRQFRLSYDIRRQLSCGNLAKQAILPELESTPIQAEHGAAIDPGKILSCAEMAPS